MYRFAPSPTGDLHIGNLRAALINFVLARRQGRGFFLRIEDTDAARNVAGAQDEILSILRAFGVSWDALYLQSDNLPTHRQLAAQVVERGLAFRCFCSEDELARKKAACIAQGLAYKYDGACEHLTAAESAARAAAGEAFVVRLKIPQGAAGADFAAGVNVTRNLGENVAQNGANSNLTGGAGENSAQNLDENPAQNPAQTTPASSLRASDNECENPQTKVPQTDCHASHNALARNDGKTHDFNNENPAPQNPAQNSAKTAPNSNLPHNSSKNSTQNLDKNSANSNLPQTAPQNPAPIHAPQNPTTTPAQNPAHFDPSYTDLIKGRVHFDAADFGAFVLLRADGTPTYNFACAVDDALEGTTCIVRGEDHVSNTPRQRLIRAALGFDDGVEFAHLPIILGADGKKMSKRDASASVKSLLARGFLPEAIANYLLLLGNKTPCEVFTLDEAAQWFELAALSRSPAKFDGEKLAQLNREHIRRASDSRLAELGLTRPELARFYTQESSFVGEIAEKIAMIYGEKPAEIFGEWHENARKIAAAIGEMLADNAQPPADFAALKDALVQKTALKGKALFAPLRLLLTGCEHGPELREIYPLLKNDLKNIIKGLK